MRFSVAGTLYALAALVATRWLVQSLDGARAKWTAAVAICLMFLVTAPLWAFSSGRLLLDAALARGAVPLPACDTASPTP